MYIKIILDYFDNMKKNKIEEKFKKDFDIKNVNEKLVDRNFLEVYKMYSSNKLQCNKEGSKKILGNYLENNCYPQNKNLFESFPYNLEKNKIWLQNSKINKKFFSENKKNFKVVEKKDEEKENKQNLEKKEYLNMVNLKLNELGENIKFDESLKAVSWFSKNYENLNKKYENKNLIENIKTQINNIQNILSEKTKKEISEISIYLELEPIKICLMGNNVEGSCLSYYSGINNFYTVFTDTIDINKLIFYIEDDFKNIIGRVFCCFDKNNKLIRFKMYDKFGLNVKYNLDEYFNIYKKKICRKYGIKYKNCVSKNNVGHINGLIWYSDEDLAKFN